MNRIKNHKIKQEIPETSTTQEHDLAFYIHDRVELMHQVFSIIKSKELKAMAPECVQDISIDDLQELCTEELLGISSKRLCAILDGADPPTDTESSSSEPLETISLDSISSDDEILSQPCSKSKKHKHRKHKSKGKHKRKNSNASSKDKDVEDRSKASRAGLTVLELLELQARARAIRAQLQQDNINKKETAVEKNDSSDEVEIKEEPPEVVEISSEDEKPKVAECVTAKPSSPKTDVTTSVENSTTIKRINNLVITVPQSKPTRKIQLKRNKVVSITTNSDTINDTNNICNDTSNPITTVEILPVQTNEENPPKPEQSKNQVKQKKKQKKKSKKVEKDGSDHDEITLQLSDTEKMDLLEDFNRKDYDNFTSSSSKDSEESSLEEETIKSIANATTENKDITENAAATEPPSDITKVSKDNELLGDGSSKELNQSIANDEKQLKTNDDAKNDEINDNLNDKEDSTNNYNSKENSEGNKNGDVDMEIIQSSKADITENVNLDVNSQESSSQGQVEEGEILSNTEINCELSEGEISDKNSTKMDPCEESSKVVCISDEDSSHSKSKKSKKKEKKSKKVKKSKKKDFRESSDQNFFDKNESNNKNNGQESNKLEEQRTVKQIEDQTDNILTILDDDEDAIFEIFELSDDSEVEVDSVWSKEPTAAEIAALSAKIDEIHNDDIELNKNNICESVENNKVEENISWRDRYLDSKKVKQVLTTSSILNALRKKNKDIKKMLQATKNVGEDLNPQVPSSESTVFVEGSVEHFNTLEASTTFIDPVVADKDVTEQNEENTENKTVSKEMEKNAKILLKMYKKLLKYNDIDKQKDPSRVKKKKKQKKSKDKEKVNTS